ncbi:MAG: cytochrome c3 family protein [Candidatus Zixiibacteriota bacterium]
MMGGTPMRDVAAIALSVLAVVLVVVEGDLRGQTKAPPDLPYEGAHLSPMTGVFRDPSVPRGDCRHCHISHAETEPQVQNLFAPNDNALCYSTSGVEGCHINRPTGGSAGYPAQEEDRFPDQHPYHGYFEANSGGDRTSGSNNRVRWPGRLIWENLTYSRHYASPAMPRLDGTGRGACLNCHDPHNGAGPYGQLTKAYGPIAGAATNGAPPEYALCFNCHGPNGPSGMSPESRRIADLYSRTATGSSRAGHAIDETRGAVKKGDRLPCYDCHNAHGSMGSDGQHPNAFLLSDQRPGWYGLTAIRTDSVQVRRFCTGCHAYPDLSGSGGMVEGVRPKTLPNEYPHRSYETKHCYDCHGRDYASPGGFNVHNPSGGE